MYDVYAFVCEAQKKIKIIQAWNHTPSPHFSVKIVACGVGRRVAIWSLAISSSHHHARKPAKPSERDSADHRASNSSGSNNIRHGDAQPRPRPPAGKQGLVVPASREFWGACSTSLRFPQGQAVVVGGRGFSPSLLFSSPLFGSALLCSPVSFSFSRRSCEKHFKSRERKPQLFPLIRHCKLSVFDDSLGGSLIYLRRSNLNSLCSIRASCVDIGGAIRRECGVSLVLPSRRTMNARLPQQPNSMWARTSLAVSPPPCLLSSGTALCPGLVLTVVYSVRYTWYIRSTGAFILHTSRVFVYILLFPFVRCPNSRISLIHCSRSGCMFAQVRLRTPVCEIARSHRQITDAIYLGIHRFTHSRVCNRSETLAARGRAKATSIHV